MLKLAFLLIGPEGFRSQWYVLAAVGVVLLGLPIYVAVDASDGVAAVTDLALGLVLLGGGMVTLLTAGAAGDGTGHRLAVLRGFAILTAGVLMIAWPHESNRAVVLLFSAALVLDGLARMGSVLFLRIPGWHTHAACGVAELTLALMMLVGWPLPTEHNVPFCVGLLIGLSGWLLLRLGLMLRTLDAEVALLLLPIFAGRGWNEHAPVLIGDAPLRRGNEHPLVVHVWTPAGAAGTPERRLLIDRYVAAVDASGVISTGHCSLEMPPDVYISHYPAVEVERSGRTFIHALRADAKNDIDGRFLNSYADEVADWCPANHHVEIRTFSPRRLRAFWAGYRQDTTYNLTNRNCCVVVVAALDAALEGSLAGPSPWLRLISLLLDPDLWVAALIRGRAAAVTWTPGATLDYVTTLARLVDRRERTWARRFAGFLAQLGRRTTGDMAS